MTTGTVSQAQKDIAKKKFEKSNMFLKENQMLEDVQ